VLPLSSPLLALALANAAWADIDDAAEQAAAALYDQDTGSSNLMVSVLAGIVFLLLVVVTGGIAYLSLKTWLDNRQEEEDKQGRKKKPIAAAASKSDDEDDDAPRQRVRVKKEKRGFGVRK